MQLPTLIVSTLRHAAANAAPLYLRHALADAEHSVPSSQLANMTTSAREAGDGNLTSASLAAVAMATTAVDAALLNVEQAVGKAGQNKQVRAVVIRVEVDQGARRPRAFARRSDRRMRVGPLASWRNARASPLNACNGVSCSQSGFAVGQ